MYNPNNITTSLNRLANRIPLHFFDMQQVLGGEGLAIARMLDEQEKRSLNVVIDEAMSTQLTLRAVNNQECERMLPEALCSLLKQSVGGQPLESTVYAIHKGQYQVMLLNRLNYLSVPIRISDAILLSVTGDVPFYVDTQLMANQCTVFDRDAQGVGLPINTLDSQRLNELLEKAISEENYELAAHVRDELEQRKE